MSYPALLQPVLINQQRIDIFVPDNQSILASYQKGEPCFDSPYWARIWPAAIGLCSFLQEHLHYIQHKKVLELAAGLGLPGIFSAAYAQQVCISDKEMAAVALIEQTIQHHKLTNTSCRIIDWNYLDDIDIPEVLLLSDINYEPAQFTQLLTVINHFIAAGCTILLSTPQRLMAKDFINELLFFCKEQSSGMVPEEAGQAAVSVFVLSQ
jgi:predicted nicotinamide N-methyase